MSDPATAAKVYTDFIAEQLKAEEARKTSLEARGLAVITTSGALVTALFGLAAVVTKQQTYTPPKNVLGLLTIATVLFVITAVLGILVNAPLGYSNVKPSEMNRAIKDLWDEPESVAQKRTSATTVKFLNRAQKLNQIKGIILLVAFALEVSAVGFLAGAVAAIL